MDEINEITMEDPEKEPDYSILDVVDDLIEEINLAAKSIEYSALSQTSQPNSAQLAPRRLPEIPLPKFTGEIKSWIIFKESFENLIHKNLNLTDVDRVHYLLGCLSNNVLSICNGIPPTGSNYSIIWKALLDKFDDKRMIANTYLDQIFAFKASHFESANSLGYFLENFNTAVQALKKLDIPDLADYILTYLAFIKLPPETQKTLENIKRNSDLLNYEEIIHFVKEQVKICFRSNNFKPKTEPIRKSKISQNFFAQENDKIQCSLCHNLTHKLQNCSQFLEKTPKERYNLVKNLNICINCLAPHKIVRCKSIHFCRVCNGRHHTLLHFNEKEKKFEIKNKFVEVKDKTVEENGKAVSGRNDEMFSLISCSLGSGLEMSKSKSEQNMVLLSTAIVFVFDSYNNLHKCRFLLDSGSQANFLTENCCRLLKLKIRPCYSKIHGIGCSDAKVLGCTNSIFCSRFNSNDRFVFDALVVRKIAEKLPVAEVDRKILTHLDTVPLADTNFHIPGKIDGILGAEVMGQILGQKIIRGPANTPVGVETRLGYLVMGTTPISTKNISTHAFCSILENDSLNNSIKKFWELENVPLLENNLVTPDDEVCETFFKLFHTRDDRGRYIVKLPFKLTANYLGNSFKNALNRLLLLEKKFEKNPIFKAKYVEIIDDYLRQGHMSEINSSEDLGYYLPHHGIFKSDSTSTPMRVVFDASSKTSSAYSLNDILYSGPKLQSDIVAILLNFRLKRVAFTADIKQMFRQILIHNDDRCFQKIIWRSSPNESYRTFSLNTVTFGVKCSPYLALRVIKQLSEDEKLKFPMAAEIVSRDMYVDDIVSSSDNAEIAIEQYNQLNNMFNAGGFELRKWSTNSPQLRKIIVQEKRHDSTVDFHKNWAKVLGMLWDSEEDILKFKFCLNSHDKALQLCTKRNILSVVARCFDPLGYVAPTLLVAKLLIKNLWELKLNWDDVPPDDILNRWKIFCQELDSLSEIKIPRFVGVVRGQPISIIGFADACSTSYGAAVYLRTFGPKNIPQTHLLYSKAKVAPSKQLTIPKLELCSAYLLAKILNFVVECYKTRADIHKIYALSDSMIVLSWIVNRNLKLDPFVANRVVAIRNLIPVQCWFHVPSKENASDVLSRGQLPNQLKSNLNWFNGPTWLKFDSLEWPIKFIQPQSIVDENIITLSAVKSNENIILEFIKRFSNWQKLLRSTVYILKFIKILPVGKDITADDLKISELWLVKHIQGQYFQKEIRLLEQNISPPNIRHLRPFLQNSIIRVGGRLKRSKLDYETKHPILLPKNGHFVSLLIDYIHQTNFHTGSHLTLSLLRTRYWILSARNLVRYRIKMCHFCFRFAPKNIVPLMGDLPASRIQKAKAFLRTGCDYAGPISIIPYRKRGTRSVKAYICLFVCMVTKAIHLELVTDLTTQGFLQALKRFISRRGDVKDIYSDNGTNFLGAKAELDKIYKLLASSEFNNSVKNDLAFKGIKWHLIPPQAPHMGGLWESCVKMVKTHLFKGIRDQLLTYEEMNTVLVQIEALLNSRPLTILSNDPSDPIALTPSHFLTLGPISDLPSPNFDNQNISHMARFQLLDKIVQDFWKRWHIEYLTSLQTRQKWDADTSPIRVGTVVLLETPNTPPLHWPLGVIEKVYPGLDNITRVVEVKTKSGLFKRPVSKTYPLPQQ